MPTRRVAVTGLGVVSAAGRDLTSFWKALTEPRPVFQPIEGFGVTDYRTTIGGEIRGGERDCFAYALAAAKAALADGGRAPDERLGVALGTTSADEWLLEKAFAETIDAGRDPREAFDKARELSPANLPARLSRALGARGPSVMLTTACAAGNYALALAFDRLRAGACDAMLAGGVDVFAPVTFAGFNRLLAVAPEYPQPFSLGRKGLIPGEGCAMLLLEDWDAASARRARIYAELLGYGASSDAFHVTMPSADGVARALADCLGACGLSPDDIDYVNAHGTGTPANDKTETAALKKVLGARAPKVPVSSIKSVLGHAMGAASALEAAACCLTLETGVLPPTARHAPGDPECDLDYVGEGARKTDPKVVLSDAFAFGGGNCVAAFAKPDGKRAPPPAPRAARVFAGAWAHGDELEREALTRLAEKALPGKDLGYLDAPMTYALLGCARVLEASGLPDPAGEGVGIALESRGEWDSLYAFYKDLRMQGPQGVEPRLFPNVLANAAAGRAAIAFGLKKLNLSLAGSFPDGEAAIAAAFHYLRSRGTGVVVAGGVDRGYTLLSLWTEDALKDAGRKPFFELVEAVETWDDAPPPAGPSLSDSLARLGSGRVVHEAAGRFGARVRLTLKPA